MTKVDKYKDQKRRLVSVQTRIEPSLYEESCAYKQVVGVKTYSEFNRMALRFFLDHLKKQK